jgi:hypothetical protein
MLKWYFTGGGSATSVLGGLISSAEATSAIFPDVTQQNAIDGITEFACICIRNTGGSTVENVGIYLSSVVTKNKIFFAKGLTGKNSTTEQTIANQQTEPTGALVFQTPRFDYMKVVLGDLAPNDFYHIWIKREVTVNTPGSPADYFIITGV